MNIYHCMIDLKPNANALAFAHAARNWFDGLKATGHIADWNLHRRKLHLAGAGYGDFLLLIHIDDLAQLDRAFNYLGNNDDSISRVYDQMHGMIDRFEVGLYRPYPDPAGVERLALV